MKKQSKIRSLFIEIAKYGAVGAISTIIDYLVLNISHKLMNNDPNLLWFATALGFCAGMINGYFMNSRWTFKYNTKGQEGKKFTQFAVISLIGLVLTELIVLQLSLHWSFNKNIAKLAAVATVFVWNYVGNKLWTFRKATATA